jgi:hypothetical protein
VRYWTNSLTTRRPKKRIEHAPDFAVVALIRLGRHTTKKIVDIVQIPS